jgi:hypothetical protein
LHPCGLSLPTPATLRSARSEQSPTHDAFGAAGANDVPPWLALRAVRGTPVGHSPPTEHLAGQIDQRLTEALGPKDCCTQPGVLPSKTSTTLCSTIS